MVNLSNVRTNLFYWSFDKWPFSMRSPFLFIKTHASIGKTVFECIFKERLNILEEFKDPRSLGGRSMI